MPYYYRSNPPEVRELDVSLVQSWIDVNNPKAAEWHPIPDPPTPQSYWDGTQWIQPHPYVPYEITRLQGLIMLKQMNLLEQCEQLISQADEITQLAWQNANHFVRQSPTMINIANALGLTEEQLDQMFIDGAQIVV